MFGSVLAVLVAPAVSALLARQLVTDPNADLPFSTQPDYRILLFNFGLALLVGVLFSLAPALRFLHPDLVGSLKQQTGTASGAPLRVRRLSVALQIGLSLLLLIGAGLFVKTLRNLRSVDLGFASDHLLSFGIDPQLAGYKTEQAAALHQRILQALKALPGSRSVGATTDPELMGMESRTGIAIPGSTSDPIIVEGPWITPATSPPSEFRCSLDGTFRSGTSDKPGVVLVNAGFARHHFGTPQNAVGKDWNTGIGKAKATYKSLA